MAVIEQKGGDSGAVKNQKAKDVRLQNMIAAKTVADTLRTSLGPKGLDKMIEDSKGGTIISNDGATILSHLSVVHPTAKMLVELSKAQDIEAGDGTTSVVILAGALLDACQILLAKGLHPQTIFAAFSDIAKHIDPILREIAIPIDLEDKKCLTDAAMTSLNSKVVSQNASLLGPMAVDAVLQIYMNNKSQSVDLKDIRVIKQLGSTVDDSEMTDGLIFTQQKISRRAGGPTRIEHAKVGLIQFCLSTPKTDMENNIIIKDYQAMDRLLREERIIIAKMVKQIGATGCNVLMVQKSILRDAVTDLSLDYLAKAKILVIRDIERDDIEYISNTVNCQPVASLEEFTAAKLGACDLVSDDQGEDGRIVKLSGCKGTQTVSVLLRASNRLMLDEAERSFHDALCVVRSLVKNQALLPGGGAPEIHLACKLHQMAGSMGGVRELCWKTYAAALEIVPYTLAENSGLNPIQIVTLLRNLHVSGSSTSGINVRKGQVSNILEEKVVQPFLVSSSAFKLATETVLMILKIDDIVLCR